MEIIHSTCRHVPANDEVIVRSEFFEIASVLVNVIVREVNFGIRPATVNALGQFLRSLFLRVVVVVILYLYS